MTTLDSTAASRAEKLRQIVITDQLAFRFHGGPRLALEELTTRELVLSLRDSTQPFLQTFAALARELCQAGSAGVSVLESTQAGDELFRWNGLAGMLAEYVGGSSPRNWSPCGLCLDTAEPILLSYPARAFTYLDGIAAPIVESLVLPIYAKDGRPLGTIWVISHAESRKFDLEDVRIMASLAEVVATVANGRLTGG